MKISNAEISFQNIELILLGRKGGNNFNDYFLLIEGVTYFSSITANNVMIKFTDDSDELDSTTFPLNSLIKVLSPNFAIFLKNVQIKSSKRRSLGNLIVTEEWENINKETRVIFLEDLEFEASPDSSLVGLILTDCYFEAYRCRFRGDSIVFHFDLFRTLSVLREVYMYFIRTNLEEIIKVSSSRIICYNLTVGGEKQEETKDPTANILFNFKENCEILLKIFDFYNIYAKNVI